MWFLPPSVNNCVGSRILSVSLSDFLKYSQLSVPFGELFDDEDERYKND